MIMDPKWGKLITGTSWGKTPLAYKSVKSLLVIDCETRRGVYVGFNREPTPNKMYEIAVALTGLTLQEVNYTFPGQQWIVLCRKGRAGEAKFMSRTAIFCAKQALRADEIQKNESQAGRLLATMIARFMEWDDTPITMNIMYTNEDGIHQVDTL